MGYVHPSVKIGQGVIIGPEVTIEEGCEIGPYSIISGFTHIGPDNRMSSHVIMGGEPQDHKFKGGGQLSVGRGNTFREFCTVHVGHLSEEGTVIGQDNMFLTGAHVAHDCVIGDRNFVANNVLLAGHTIVDHEVNISGHVGTHQFCRIGSYAMLSGMSAIRQDVLPYAITQGDPARIIGINKVGLARKGFSSEQIFLIREAYRAFRNGLDLEGNSYYTELKAFKDE